jgi:uncharacterized iron-regulated membrane protein
VTVVVGGKTFYVDAYSGVVLGEASTGIRRAMRTLRDWHRWLAAEGDNRPLRRAITGWATVVFAFIVVTGAYLWIPRSRAQLRAVLFFRAGLRGKARDFNWHNVLGAWACVPLFIVAVSAWPISFEWANAAVYRAMGEPVPLGRGGGDGARGGQTARPGGESARGQQASDPAPQARARVTRSRQAGAARQTAALDPQALDALVRRAQRQEPAWKNMTVRWPASPSAPVQFAIDRSDGGRPQARSTLTLTRAGETVSYETFASQSPGRRLRSVLRFAHTGEVLGLPGQVIAGAASAAGTVLVWTGLALVWRRGAGWIRRHQRRAYQDTSDRAIDSAA